MTRLAVPAGSPAPLSREGEVVLLGPEPVARGRTTAMCLAAVPDGDAGPRLVMARFATSLALEMGEPYADFIRGVQVRATLAPASPRLLAALGKDGRLRLVVEEHAGDVALRDLIEAAREANGATPVGLALHVGARVAAVFAAAEQHGALQVQVGPEDVRLDWHGTVRTLPKPYPRWEERTGGAMAGMVTTSIDWLSPERLMGYRTSARGEMYTLGVLLWEALVGRHPLHRDGASLFARLQATVQEDAPLLASARPDVPPDVAALIDRCMRRDERARFASWAELSAALACAHDRIERFDAQAVAGVLAQLFPEERARALAFADEVRMLDLAQLRATLPTQGFEAMTVTALPRGPDIDDAGPAWEDDGTQPDIDVGAWGADARPMARMEEHLLVDLAPVSNAEYARFITATERAAPAHWGGRTPPLALFDAPVAWVSYDDALAYARWARKRIPTAEEWQRAVVALGARLGTGAVWEWTSTEYQKLGHIVRGGAWRDRRGAPAEPTNTSFETQPAADVGFRCVGEG